jgi:3',5'-cyclic AMP phosphodiesterase CpdA
MSLTRRQLLTAGASIGLAPLIRGSALSAITPAPLKRRFRFVHFSDIHIQPELGAVEGTALALTRLRALRPDFIITGGDHVMDVLKASNERADVQFNLYAEAFRPIGVPIHSVIGNHDIFGWGRTDALQTDPNYGKRMVEERVLKQPAYRSFDFGGWHFALLDSVQASPTTVWHGAIDDAQLTWLDDDLTKAAGKPTILVTHVPVMSLITTYTEGNMTAPGDMNVLINGREIQRLCAKHRVHAVLQGHTHIVEDCEYLGTHYITGGAVCGDWWKGPRLGVHPEGFMVFDVDGDRLNYRYEASGWHAHA